MFEQAFIDGVIVIAMFVLRIGVPVAALYLVGRWLGQKLQPQEMQNTSRERKDGKIIPFVKPTAMNTDPIQAQAKGDTDKRATA
ncbi:hypothetical protein ANRL3_01026 [Anaerolineae bacterium]|nr:hypothetical protein ANRL3_01026 [Anaerolineae bacterium]